MSKFIELQQSKSKTICINLDTILYFYGDKNTTIYFNTPQGNKDGLNIFALNVINSYEDVKNKVSPQ